MGRATIELDSDSAPLEPGTPRGPEVGHRSRPELQVVLVNHPDTFRVCGLVSAPFFYPIPSSLSTHPSARTKANVVQPATRTFKLAPPAYPRSLLWPSIQPHRFPLTPDCSKGDRCSLSPPLRLTHHPLPPTLTSTTASLCPTTPSSLNHAIRRRPHDHRRRCPDSTANPVDPASLPDRLYRQHPPLGLPHPLQRQPPPDRLPEDQAQLQHRPQPRGHQERHHLPRHEDQ